MKKEQVYVKCNICGSDDYDVLFDEGKAQINRIVQCRHCDLIYANPQTDNVSDVEVSYALADEWYGKDSNDIVLGKYNPENHQYLKKQYLQLYDYGKILDFTDQKDKGKFVEVGSYAGIFLNEAKKRGWEVIGIEPLEIPALYSEKEFGIKAIREYFEEAELEPNSVDVVVSCHVIEHVHDPGAFIRKASKLLKSGGNLILETPAYDSLTFKLLRHHERSIRCDGHIYFFTKKSLSTLVEKNGFKVVKHEKVGRTLTLDRLFYNLGIITGKKVFFSSMSTILGLNKYVVRLNMRDMQRIYCQKN